MIRIRDEVKQSFMEVLHYILWADLPVLDGLQQLLWSLDSFNNFLILLVLGMVILVGDPESFQLILPVSLAADR